MGKDYPDWDILLFLLKPYSTIEETIGHNAKGNKYYDIVAVWTFPYKYIACDRALFFLQYTSSMA